MLSRRSFLVSAGAGIAAGSLMSRAFADHHGKLPIGIQLWTVKSEMEKDVEGTLKKLYAYGFREIEFAGFYGKTAAEMGKMLKSIGLTPVSMHAGAREIEKDGAQILADARTLGLRYIVCSSPGVSPEKEKLAWEDKMRALDLDDIKWNAKLFDKFGAQVSAANMKFGYHNHDAEFAVSQGKALLDWLMDLTRKENVNLELDVGWATVAKVDPLGILDRYKDRVIALHVKDVGKPPADGKHPTSVALGEGVTDWKKVLAKARKNGTKAFFYEQEEPFTRPILDSAKMSAAYLSKLDV